MSKTQNQKDYTPALAYAWLTPFYDVSVRMFTREKRWRKKLIELASPRPDDRILDIGCGTGTLAIWLKKQFPDCQIVGIDPDRKTLDLAQRKAHKQGIDVEWIHGFVDAESKNKLGKFSLILSSLVLHQTPLTAKREIIETAREMLSSTGRFCIADYGVQPNWMMKSLYRLVVQTLDGKKNTQPNADGYILKSLEDVGFENVTHACDYYTLTGSISLFFAS